MTINIANDTLWGNEAGEDEDVKYLSEYFLSSAVFSSLENEQARFSVVMSKKGVGKSSALRKLYYNKDVGGNALSIYVKASEFAAIATARDLSNDDNINQWKKMICTKIFHEIVNKIKYVPQDIESLTISGHDLSVVKNKNIISFLMEKLSLINAHSATERKRIESGDHIKTYLRYQQEKNIQTWIFIDDIDATFVNGKEEKIRCASFFNACRDLVRDIDGLFIRASVRTDVWAILRQADESMDKMNQYIYEIKWTPDQTGKMLINKIKAFLKTTGNPLYNDYALMGDQGAISKLVFENTFPWGRGRIPPFKALHTYSYGRPRWESQLCKISASIAKSHGRDIITYADITEALPQYGRIKVDDIYREHSHQFPDIVNLIEIFSNKDKRYKTKRLLEVIAENYIGARGTPEIEGRKSYPNVAIEIARFLFRIGFIGGRDMTCPNPPCFVRFEDRPNLLSSKINLDDGMEWEIHPVYRGYLHIGNMWPDESDCQENGDNQRESSGTSQ